MAVKYQHPRGTRANLNALAASNSLVVGQVYLITDEARLAVATSVSAYQDFAKASETAAPTVSNAVTAGTDAQGQGALTSDINIVTTTPNAPSGVTLPPATPGRRVMVTNNGTNQLSVYPASGDKIDPLPTDIAHGLQTAGATITFTASSSSQWHSGQYFEHLYANYIEARFPAGGYGYLTGQTGAAMAELKLASDNDATTLHINGNASNVFVEASHPLNLKVGASTPLLLSETGAGATLAASTTGMASLRIPHGTAPTSPTDGDVWSTTTGVYARVNGSTVGPFGAGGGAPAWGSITGTLSSQTDLQSALDLKAPLASPAFTTSATVTGVQDPRLALKSTSSGILARGALEWLDSANVQYGYIGNGNDFENSIYVQALSGVLDLSGSAGMNCYTGSGTMYVQGFNRHSVLRVAGGSTGYDAYSEYYGGATYRGATGYYSSAMRVDSGNGIAIEITGNTGVNIDADGSGSVNLRTTGTTRLSASSTGVAVTGTLVAPTINDAAGVNLQFNGSTKLATTTSGVAVTGTLQAGKVNDASGVEIHYNGNAKLATTTTGVTVTGNVNITGAYQVNGVALAVSPWTTVMKTSDEARQNSDINTVDGALTMTLGVGTWQIRGFIKFKTATASPDFKFELNHTGTATNVMALYRYSAAVNGFTTETQYMTTSTTGSFSMTSTSTGPGYLDFEHTLTVTASGNYQFKWAQNTSDPALVTVFRGSYLEYAAA